MTAVANVAELPSKNFSCGMIGGGMIDTTYCSRHLNWIGKDCKVDATKSNNQEVLAACAALSNLDNFKEYKASGSSTA